MGSVRGKCEQSYPRISLTCRDMNIKTAALLIFSAIFSGKDSIEIDYVSYRIKRRLSTKVRYVKLGGYTFIEQNPFKLSPWGKELVEGHQVLWVMRGREYVAIVRDGKFRKLT
ncbi:MAG: hypothetical protein ACFFEE_03660 [Candidatus Thorarchaeota archaeon]